ncbi:NAD(P)H-dependent oxidoreductase [Sphingomonas sp. T9W2]|uniref:FMN-dependent NADH-azoreductase n=1 Tax=Sphingomonas sp. T9W2 TaxID=3143183 RepID=UPI0031F4FBA6
MNILHIDASASDSNASHTRRLSSELVAWLGTANPDATIVYRDLFANPLPHVDTTIRDAWTGEDSSDTKLAETMRRFKALVDELKAADVVVVGSPMFTVPSTLKARVDHVSIAGQIFGYTAEGPRDLLSGRVYLILSSGGIYSRGPFAAYDHLSTYLTAIFNFFGIQDVEVIQAEGIAYGPEQHHAAMTSAAKKFRRSPLD